MLPDPLTALLLATGITLLLLWLFFPKRGVYWRWQRTRLVTARVQHEDALKHIYQCELDGETCSIKSLAGALNVNTNEAEKILEGLQERELIELAGSNLRLTPTGIDYALRVIRAHRLYERYLADETGYREDEWHDQAHRIEHELSPEEVEALAHRLGNPTHDPHGDPIPTSSGYVVYPSDSQPITSLEPGRLARIVHMEDEPEAVYAQLVAEGLQVGQEIQVVETNARRVRFWSGGFGQEITDEHVLAPLVAANIGVIPMIERVEELPPLGRPLSSLKPGEEARVQSLLPGIRGAERRRLMDLGLLPGTLVSAEMVSAGGDPTAYRIRGALIALRKSQSDFIYVCSEDEECFQTA